MGKREPEALGDKLLDVRALDVVDLLDLGNSEDLDLHTRQYPEPLFGEVVVGSVAYMNRPESCAVAGSHVLV